MHVMMPPPTMKILYGVNYFSDITHTFWGMAREATGKTYGIVQCGKSYHSPGSSQKPHR